MRPRLLALCLLVLLAACGGAERRPPAPERDELVGTADVERLLVSTQKRKSPKLRVGAASCPDQVRLANGTRFTCTVRIEGTEAPYAVTLRDVDAAGTGGRFALEPAKPIIDVTRIVSLIRSKLQPTAPRRDRPLRRRQGPRGRDRGQHRLHHHPGRRRPEGHRRGQGPQGHGGGPRLAGTDRQRLSMQSRIASSGSSPNRMSR